MISFFTPGQDLLMGANKSFNVEELNEARKDLTMATIHRAKISKLTNGNWKEQENS